MHARLETLSPTSCITDPCINPCNPNLLPTHFFSSKSHLQAPYSKGKSIEKGDTKRKETQEPPTSSVTPPPLLVPLQKSQSPPLLSPQLIHHNQQQKNTKKAHLNQFRQPPSSLHTLNPDKSNTQTPPTHTTACHPKCIEAQPSSSLKPTFAEKPKALTTNSNRRTVQT